MPLTDAAQVVFSDLAALEAELERMGVTPSDEAPGLSELDHGLQCAHELRLAAPDDVALQVAGLVHDIGHRHADDRGHAWAGARAVRGVLGDRAARLVGLHIAAKRYLVAADPGYFARLSPDSVRTLALQGGAMTPPELAAFEAQDGWRDALALRRADEAAKVPGRAVPGLDAWRPALRALAAAVTLS
jgi:predicted HD phosphohydrolase